mgnify:CR=1 FL=1
MADQKKRNPKLLYRIVWKWNPIKPVIETNIAIQRTMKHFHHRKYQLPFENMRIGSSFKVMFSEMRKETVAEYKKIYMTSDKNKRKNGSMKAVFITRQGMNPDGQLFTRVWRVHPSDLKVSRMKYTTIRKNQS